MAFMAVSLFSCGGSEADDPSTGGGGSSSSKKEPTVFRIAASQATFSPSSQSARVSITCDVAWSVKAEGDWFSLSPTSGKGGSTSEPVTVTIKLNETQETRTGKIVFTAGTKTNSLDITQKPLSSMLPATDVILVKSQVTDFKVTTNDAWSLSIPSDAESWLSCEPKSGTGIATIKLQGKDENENVGDRKTTLTLTIASDKFQIPVTQKQKNVILLQDATVARDYQAGTFEVASNTNVDFEVEVTEGSAWLTYVSTKALNSKTTTFHIDQNSGDSQRTAIVTFKAEDVTETLEVNQGPYNAVIEKTNPGIYALNGNDYVYVAGSNQTSVLKTSDNLSFRIVNPNDLNVTEISGIPADASFGTKATVGLKILEGVDVKVKTSVEAFVLKNSDETLWLALPDGTGAIIMK